MQLRVRRDEARFRAIVRGLIRKNLKRYLTRGAILGRQGRQRVRVPLPEIALPHLSLDPHQGGAVGSAPGSGDGEGKAGKDPATEHELEVGVSLDELTDILGEELELPRVQPKGEKIYPVSSGRYSGISHSGPESLRHMPRTFRQTLKREIAGGLYDPEHPVLIPGRRELRYRTRKTQFLPQASAALIYMMDVSGSMGADQKEWVRLTAFWIDRWIRRQYPLSVVRYITHDAEAREVDEEAFYSSSSAGGTLISTAYDLARRIIEKDHPPQLWNLYLFHFSDGDNWSEHDNEISIKLMRSLLLDANLFAYGQVKSSFGSGRFMDILKKELKDEEKLALASITERDEIMEALRTFLGKRHAA